MKIAFSSKDGIHVNDHFGWADTFYLYEIEGDEKRFLKKIEVPLKKEDEIEKLTYKTEAVSEADVLYVLQIGPKAVNLVKSYDLFPLKAKDENETIESVLDQFIAMQDSPPLWLKRILLKK